MWTNNIVRGYRVQFNSALGPYKGIVLLKLRIRVHNNNMYEGREAWCA